MTVLNPIDVGTGWQPFLGHYAPVSGAAYLTDWSFGGGGNYIRPWTSFSQRLVEANWKLGPFGMRLGGNISGRILISTEYPSLGELAYCDQPWYGFDDGPSGYPSKAEWFGTVVKTVIQARDLNTEGHPLIHVEVAVLDPTDPAERYTPPSWWDTFSHTIRTMGGIIPNNMGWMTGNPFPQPPNDDDTTGNNTPPVSDMAEAVANWTGGMLNLFEAAMASTYEFLTGESLADAKIFLANVMNGIEAGQMGVNTHIEHNRTPPDTSGGGGGGGGGGGSPDFAQIPGELNTNPKDLELRDGLQQDYAVNLGDGSGLTPAVGDVTTPNGIDSGKLNIALVNQGLDTSRNWYGVANQGKGTTAFFIHGRTIFNEGNSGGNPYAAPNPTIDSDGNLRIYDTYEFQNSGLDAVADIFVAPFSQSYATELKAWFDTSPGFHTAPSLSDAGAVRITNEGGTPGNSNISALANTYIGVVVTPQNLNASNPTLYNNLKNNGFYDHVDPSLLP
tara:strand:+ start:264 stop:1769 length:1506 start_codon:yes stop_codon:yes gene_type:complete